MFGGAGPLAARGWLAIPALFVLTVLFAGLSGERPAVRTLRAAAPMVGLVFAGTWLVQAADLLRPLASDVSTDRAPAPLAVWVAVRDGGDPAIGLTGPLPLVVAVLVGAVAAQLGHLDRVSLRVGRREE